LTLASNDADARPPVSSMLGSPAIFIDTRPSFMSAPQSFETSPESIDAADAFCPLSVAAASFSAC
jgi:hypothetical protein